MIRVGVFGTTGFSSIELNSIEKFNQTVGNNTGNMVYQFALWNSVKNPKIVFDIGTSVNYIRENADHIIIPSANQINPKFDMGSWANMLEKINLPVSAIGLGAQFDSYNDVTDLQPGTKRYLDILSNFSKEIGVRGEFTANVLNDYGIKNVVITGCPSQLINRTIKGTDIYERIIKLKENRLNDNLPIMYLFGTMEEISREYERKLIGLLSEDRYKVMLQTNIVLQKKALNIGLNETENHHFNWLLNYLSNGANNSNIKDSIMKAVIYSSVPQWIDDLHNYRYVIGPRIHGAIMAIQSNNLGICTYFDSRTKELADTLEIPRIEFSKTLTSSSIHDFIDQIQFDPTDYELKKLRNIKNIESVLNKNCIHLI